jgi:hypothetical protein
MADQDNQNPFSPSGGYFHNHDGVNSPLISQTAGVTSIGAGAGISATPSTGNVTITNTGVTSIVAGTNITISGATGAVTVNAASIKDIWKFGTNNSRNYNAASGTQTIAHGFTGTPSYLEITASISFNNTTWYVSQGIYDGTNNLATFWGSAGAGMNTGNSVYILDSSGNSQIATATLDATNIYLAWTKGGTPGSTTISLFFKVWG